MKYLRATGLMDRMTLARTRKQVETRRKPLYSHSPSEDSFRADNNHLYGRRGGVSASVVRDAQLCIPFLILWNGTTTHV